MFDNPEITNKRELDNLNQKPHQGCNIFAVQ